ncbi:MAG: hypothetical protein ACI841_001285 [Planctomycetota bacterium]|jgi:hypothetical protein
MTRGSHSRIALGSALVLLALHLDFWRPQRLEVWFGWIPEELLWRLAWMALAVFWILYASRYVWVTRDGQLGEGPGERAPASDSESSRMGEVSE